MKINISKAFVRRNAKWVSYIIIKNNTNDNTNVSCSYILEKKNCQLTWMQISGDKEQKISNPFANRNAKWLTYTCHQSKEIMII